MNPACARAPSRLRWNARVRSETCLLSDKSDPTARRLPDLDLGNGTNSTSRFVLPEAHGCEYRTAANNLRRCYPAVLHEVSIQNDSYAQDAFLHGTGEIFRGETANCQYVPSNVPRADSVFRNNFGSLSPPHVFIFQRICRTMPRRSSASSADRFIRRIKRRIFSSTGAGARDLLSLSSLGFK